MSASLKLVLVFMATLFLLTACASVLNIIERHEIAAKTVVTQTVLRIIEDHDEPQVLAYKIKSISDTIASEVAKKEIASIEQLEEKARLAINWQRLSVANQDLVDALITKIARELKERSGEDFTIEDEVRIRTVFQWISNAALRYL